MTSNTLIAQPPPPPRASRSPEVTAPNASNPVEVQLDGVEKQFGGHVVFHEVELSIRRGEMITIVGASGCGKTVMLKLMIGNLRPDRGHVRAANHEARGSPLVDLATLTESQMDQLRRHWGVVFQKNALFSGTVFDNIALGLTAVKGWSDSAARARSVEMLRAVGLAPEEVLDLNREDLSGGMAKRVAVARALALDPALVFYDEPTTGLDPEHAEQIQDLIRDVHAQRPDVDCLRTSVIVTHDIRLMYRLQPRVVMLHEGSVFFDGSASEFASLDSPVTRPYREMMPQLHRRPADAERPERLP